MKSKYQACQHIQQYQSKIENNLMRSEAVQNFLSCIEGDNQTNRMVKYQQFFRVEPKLAIQIKEAMAHQAIQNGLITQYQGIMKLADNQLPQKIGVYKERRQKFVQQTNRSKAQAQQFQAIDNLQQQVKCYMKIAGIYHKAGEYHQASEFYKKIFRYQKDKQFLKKQQYFEQWALSTFYNQSWTELMTFLHCELDMSSRKNLVNLAIIQDLKMIEMKRSKNFQNLIGLKFSLQQIQRNRVLSIQELGFVYTLNLVAHKSRADMKKDVRWSSKLQILFVRTQYSKFLAQLDANFDKFRFQPFIALVYPQLRDKIQTKVIQQILDSYADAGFDRVKQLAGIKEQQIMRILQKKGSSQYLVDPSRACIVNTYQVKNNNELMKEVEKYDNFISLKYEAKMVNALQLDGILLNQESQKLSTVYVQNENAQN